MNQDSLIDGLSLRRGLAQFPTGVVALCAQGPSGPVGMAVNSFTSVSLDPPLVSVCMARTSRTWRILADMPRIGISVLGLGHGPICRQLAAREGDRFAGVDWQGSDSGAVFINGSALWLDSSVDAVHDGGDHVVVILRVMALTEFPEVRPLVFHQSQFRELTHAPVASQSHP